MTSLRYGLLLIRAQTWLERRWTTSLAKYSERWDRFSILLELATRFAARNPNLEHAVDEYA